VAEISFKSSGIKVSDPSLQKVVNNPPVGIKTPLEIGTGRSGIFQMHFDPVAQIDDNLKNLILTNKGERLGNYSYGADLKRLTTELTAHDDFDALAMTKINKAVKQFMPFVELDSFQSSFGKTIDKNNSIKGSITKIDLIVRYGIPQLKVTGRVISVSLYCIG
jgi:phage baseplate assembly protein W